MQLRDLIHHESEAGRLVTIREPVSHYLQAAAMIAGRDPKMVYFENVDGWDLVANVIKGRETFATALGLEAKRFLAALTAQLRNQPRLELRRTGPCFDRHYEPPNLEALPILHHFTCDGGRYLTSGVWIVNDPELGRNLSYHRMMVLDPRTGSVRTVEQRGMDLALKRLGVGAEVAICIGAPINVLLAAALSPARSVDEMTLAAALAPVTLAPCRTIAVEVPIETEWVLEARLTDRRAAEGPFVDITGTIDFIREQPVFEITAISSRNRPIYHALLPAGTEHQALMGLPKELDIYQAVSSVCPCLDVRMTPGGCSWLHAVIQIAAHSSEDAQNAVRAAFAAHKSLKHVVVVDDDINLSDPAAVEWAIATRVQAERDVMILADQPSSSLDPSAHHIPGQKSKGSKVGIDATIKAASEAERQLFRKVQLHAN